MKSFFHEKKFVPYRRLLHDIAYIVQTCTVKFTISSKFMNHFREYKFAKIISLFFFLSFYSEKDFTREAG